MTKFSDNPFLFVCGVPRSGTTLLQRMLNSHPDLAVANDSHFVPRALELTDKSLRRIAIQGQPIPLTDELVESVRTYHRFYRLGISKEDFAATTANAETYQELVSGLYDVFAGNHGKRLAGEKTPDYVRRLRLLNGLFPDAKLIHLVRDGRNVALSLLNWATPNKGPGKIELWSKYPVAVCALWWRWLAMAGWEQAQAIDPSVITTINYEDMTADPKISMSLLCDFFDLDFSPQMLEYHQGKAKEQGTGSAKSAWLAPQTGLRDWRNDMADEQVELFEALASDALHVFGYELSGRKISPAIQKIASECSAWWEANFLTRHKINNPNIAAEIRNAYKPHQTELYQPDDRLPGLTSLLDTGELAKRLDHDALDITNIRYKPGTSCLVSYQVAGKNPTTYLHAKAFAADDWNTRKKKLSDSAFIDDELAFAVFAFPEDAELPQLAEFINDPNSFLKRVLFDEFEGKTLKRYEVLAYKPNRRIVAKLDFGDEKLVLKMHAPSTFSEVQGAASALKQLGFSEIPLRQGKSIRYQTLAYEWLPGETLDLGSKSTSERTSLLKKVLSFLDRLHQPIDTKRVGLPIRLPGEGVRQVANYLERISPFGDVVERLATDILDNVSLDYSPTLVHGDFYDRQLIVNENKVRACDFDNCCVSDPVVDLANFVAHLRFRGSQNTISPEIANEINEQICLHLVASGERELLSRYNWNQAACLFRLATHPFRSGDPDWILQTESVLSNVAKQIQVARESTAAKKVAMPELASTEILSDPKFKFLANVFEPANATSMLREHLPELTKKFGRFTVNRVVARRHKPGRRCVLGFELATDQGLISILGKSSAKRLDRRAFKAQRRLFKHYDFKCPNVDQVCVPFAIGCCKPWQMWFQYEVDAVAASELMSTGTLHQVAERIASAIAKLHQSGFATPRKHTIADEMSILTDRLNKVIDELPQFAIQLSRILENCNTIASSISPDVQAPLHRDFYQDQILFSDQQAWLIDLDLIAIGHPALDVGNFVAHLTEHGIRIHGDPKFWIEEESKFLNRYLELNSACSRFEIESFKAISLARHIYISHSMTGRRDATSTIVEHVAHLTDELSERKLKNTHSDKIGVEL